MPSEGNDVKTEAGVAESKSSEGAAPEPKLDLPRTEVSAQAVARMMGVATNTEIKLLEGKLDLISSRLSNMTVRLEKIVGQFNQLPTGSDLERIDVQIGSLKTMLREFITGAKEAASPSKTKEAKKSTTVVTADSTASIDSEEGGEVSEESEEAQA